MYIKILDFSQIDESRGRSSPAPPCTIQNLYYGTSDLQLHVLKWQKMTSNLQLRVIRRIHKNATEVHSENNEKFKYCKECISGENKSIEK